MHLARSRARIHPDAGSGVETHFNNFPTAIACRSNVSELDHKLARIRPNWPEVSQIGPKSAMLGQVKPGIDRAQCGPKLPEVVHNVGDGPKFAVFGRFRPQLADL